MECIYKDCVRSKANIIVDDERHPFVSSFKLLLSGWHYCPSLFTKKRSTQKAFDLVSLQYLIHTLQRFQCFSLGIIKWTNILYSNPQSHVKVNGFLSDCFFLDRGCRQGCSLLPLLFNSSIEPLAQLIREDCNIKGLTTNGEQHKISMYADDMLLYLSKP